MPTFSNTTAIRVPPAGDTGTTTSTIEVSGVTGTIADLNLTTSITHSWSGDLDIFLISPNNTRVTLSDSRGGSTADAFNGTVWDDEAATAVTDNATASPLRPEGSLAAFDGEDANGTWTLEITDDVEGDTGDLNQWSIEIDETPVASFNYQIVTNAATSAAVGNNIVISFNEAIRNLDDSEITDPTSLITLKQTDASGADIPFTATINAAKTQITIATADLTSALGFSQPFYIELADVEDATDNTTGVINTTFSTAAPPPPPAPPTPAPAPEPAPEPTTPAPEPAPEPTPAPVQVIVIEEVAPEPVPEPAPPRGSGVFLDGNLLEIALPDVPASNTQSCEIEGTEGDDLLTDDASNNSLCGLGGHDTIEGHNENDSLNGNSGNDVIFGGNGNDLVNGGENNDVIVGNSEADRLYCHSGDDTIFGNTGNDLIDGGAGLDLIFAGQDNDLVNGGANFDEIMGDIGYDTIDGNAGNDVIFGNAGDDVLDGDDGDDWVLGGRGNDIVMGGAGSDVIRGNLDNDILIGGAGGDRFDFRPGDGSDIISDFTDGQDIIGLLPNLTFKDLTISQVGNDTQITATELVITLQSVNSGAIDTNDFAVLE